MHDEGETLAETALRESFEEIGLEPASVDLLGALPAVHTVVSGILVVPFVGMVEGPPVYTVSDAEIAAVLTLPVARLAAAETVVEHERGDGRVWRGWAYEVDGRTVWGATGVMLHALLQIVGPHREEERWTQHAR